MPGLSSVCSVLILFSMISLYYASMESICKEGFYCPVGGNCSDNSTMFCKEGVCPGNETERIDLENERCDQDPIKIRFMNSAFSVSEINGPAEPVLALSRSLNCCTISVKVNVTDGTAKGGEDYEKLENNLAEAIFPAGSTRADFEVNMIDDKVFEGASSEVFNLAIVDTSLPYGVVFDSFSGTNAVVTILDDDFPVITFEKALYTVGENDTLHVHIILSHRSNFNMTIIVNTIIGTATECDFDFGQYEVRIPAYSMTGHLDIPITDDAVFELNETFSLTIENGSLPQLIKAGVPRIATVTILDDEEEVTVGFEESMYVIHEGGESIAPVLELSKPLNCCATIRAKLEMDGMDDLPLIFNYTFLAGESIAYPDDNVSITDDMKVEPNKSIAFRVLEISLPYGVVKNDNGDTAITVVDDDNSLKLMVKENVVPEDSGKSASFCLVLGRPARENISVIVGTITTTASENSDYIPGPFTIIIPKGKDTVEFNVAILDDEVEESNETFNVFVSGVNLPDNLNLLVPKQSTVTILDNDLRCSFEESSYIVNEGDSLSALLILTKSIYKEVPVRIYYDNDEDTGIQNDDYDNSMVDHVIPQSETNDSITIQTHPDALFEKNETFDLVVILPEQDTTCRTTITIVDDNKCEFNQDVYEVDEGHERIVNLTFTKELTEDIMIPLMYQTNDHITSNDFAVQRPKIVVLPAGKKFVTFKIRTRPDAALEANETFKITATPSSDAGITCSTNFTIIDDNKLRFSSPTQVDEGEKVKLTLTLDKPLSVDLRVPFHYEYRGYPKTTRSVTFAPGVIQFEIEIDISQDRVLEGDEQFFVIATPRAQPPGSRNATAAVTIKDDDALSVEFQDNDGVNDGMITISNKNDDQGPRLRLNSTAAYELVFSVDEVNGTAFGGVDFNYRNYKVPIPAGEQFSRTLLLDAIDDTVVEPQLESYSLLINESSLPANVVAGKRKTMTVNIKDDDECTVSLIETEVYFSNPLYVDVDVNIQFTSGKPQQNTTTLEAGKNSVKFDPNRYQQILLVLVFVPDSIRNYVHADDRESKIMIVRPQL